jgi:hypothetical protein
MVSYPRKKNDRAPAVIRFQVISKLGMEVRTTEHYWKVITKIKHPVIRGKELQVQKTLKNPGIIRRSKSDDKVYLFYRRYKQYYIVVVVRKLNKKEGFIITSYLTHNIIEGKQIWPKVKR